MNLGMLARVALLAALWSVGGTTVFAQLQSGRIVGTVYDPQRAGVPGATVTVTNLATNIARTVVTDSEGNYVVTPLDPGTYSVGAEVPGFQKTVRDGLVLTVGLSARVELALDLGTLSTEVQVRAESPLLNTESATLSQVITNEQIVDLPLNGRGFHELARLTSGVALLPPTGNVQTVRPEQVNGNVIGGVGGAQTRFLLDGVDITEEHQGGTWIQTSVDALQEFSVQQNAYSAEFHGAGATFNVTTKSGGNVFHGSLFEFVRNDAFDAKNYFATSKEQLERNQYRRDAWRSRSDPGALRWQEQDVLLRQLRRTEKGTGRGERHRRPDRGAAPGRFPWPGTDFRSADHGRHGARPVSRQRHPAEPSLAAGVVLQSVHPAAERRGQHVRVDADDLVQGGSGHASAGSGHQFAAQAVRAVQQAFEL